VDVVIVVVVTAGADIGSGGVGGGVAGKPAIIRKIISASKEVIMLSLFKSSLLVCSAVKIINPAVALKAISASSVVNASAETLDDNDNIIVMQRKNITTFFILKFP